MRRLTILLAAVGALMLVPAAQAFANATMTVDIAGTGSAELTSVGGFEGSGHYEGEPPIECSYASPGPSTGICESEMTTFESSAERISLLFVPGPGSEFSGWTIEAGEEEADCKYTETYSEEELIEFLGGIPCTVGWSGENPNLGSPTSVIANVTSSGPTNRRTLTITKSAGGTGGVGSVTSKPKGINCATACNEAVASMYKETPVLLKEKPATGSTFVEWTGACSGSAETCTVPMAEAESVGAVFGGVSKAIANPQPLTLSKGESSGYGTVKATGLTCEADCTSEVALYQGPTGVAPKNKPGKLVTLKATAAYGSEFSGWSGCDSEAEGNCLVTMEEAASVTATFTAKPTATLTVNKAGAGTGTVTSKPKAISCATACTTQDATVPEEAAVILKEKPATGMTFEGWTGACVGAGETCTVELSEAGTVTAKFGGAPKAIANPQELTLTKAGSGLGTVKGTGLTCEVLCTSTVSLYQGPTGIAPKNKPGKTVVLKALSAPGSAQVEWSGCLSEPTPAECSVTMEEAEEVTATFNELP